ncbi:hypothetical protein QE400_003808 [Xanthomonas sacchari]|nr:hypothetical protein [Xanthomonas sacchari]
MTSTFLAPASTRMTLNSVCSSTGAAAHGRTGSGDRGGGGDAELVFDGLDQLHHFHEGLFGDCVDDLLVRQGHCDYLWNFFWMRF